MATIDWSALATAAENALAEIAALAPLASIAGPTGTAIGNLIAAGATAGQTILAEAQSAGGAISTGNLATIKSAVTTIQLANDALAEQIAAS